jgi:hypothetical protein
MNPTRSTRRLSVTLAALAAAALALPACQGTATAASHKPLHHHVGQTTAQPTENGLTLTDLKDLANVKRDLFRRMAQQAQNGLTFTDAQGLAKLKRDVFQGLAEHPPRS